MKTIMYFVAEDGTRFENEDECVRYERAAKANSFKNEISFYDADRKPMNVDGDFDSVYFILVKSLGAAQWLINLCRDEGCESPFDYRGVKPGLYWWDDDFGHWRCWEEESDKLDEYAEYFQLFK